MRLIIGEPVREDLVFAGTIGADDAEKARIQVGEGIQILAVHAPDPIVILLRVSAIADAYEQRNRFPCPSKGTARTNLPYGSPAGHVRSADEATYCFGGAPAAEAAEFAASAAALAAAAESAAAEAAASGAAAGGVVSAAGAGGASVLAQALSTNAATKALIASLVFIVSIPQKNLWIERYKQTGHLGLPTQKCMSGPILEGFARISYLFRLVGDALGGPYSCAGLWRIL
jgi:hypothetical protein